MRIRLIRTCVASLLSLAAALEFSGCGFPSAPSLNESVSITVGAYAVTANVGAPVTLSATISNPLATGTVTFYNGSTQIGTAGVSNAFPADFAVAQLSTTFSSPGAQVITAKYGGSQFFASSESGPITIGIYSNSLAPTSTTLQASNLAPAFDTNVTLTATVSPSAATGTVNFFYGSTQIGSGTLSSGVATATVSFAYGGPIALTATYSGDYLNASSTSSPLAVNVSGPLATSINLQASTAATAVGDNVTLTASLTPSAATGSVTFYSGSTAIGTSNASSGAATLTTTFASSGQLQLTAKLTANSAYAASTSDIVGLFVTGDTPSTVTLQASPSNPVLGDAVTLDASVSPATATGTMNFYNGTSFIGSSSLSGGSASFFYPQYFMVSGPQNFTAVYSGDTTYLSSSGGDTVTVAYPGSNPTVTALTLDNTSVYSGDFVTMTANVAPATATGEVTFMNGDTPLGVAQVTAGTAVFAQAFNVDGTFNITAVYNGDPNDAASTSNVVVLNVYDNSDDDDARSGGGSPRGVH
jgi:hypothetical protein